MTIEPEDERALAQVVAGAAGPLRIVGGGTRDVGAPCAGEALSTRRLAGVHLYEPGALTLVVGAGTPLSRVEALLGEEGQRLPFEPMDHRPLLGSEGEPTIGGAIAANISGPRRFQVGAARDFLLGVRFVDGRGEIVKSGGRVMKNVTGYDLVKLMAGSWGTLGILSEVSLKVLARPEAEITLERQGEDVAGAVASLARALGSPYDASGAAYLDARTGGGTPRTLLRLEGFAESVAYRREALAGFLGGDWQIREAEESSVLWRNLRDVVAFGDAPVVWRISLKPSSAPVLLSELEAAGLGHRVILDWGGGLIWLAPDAAPEDAGAALIRGTLARLGGHARLEKAPLEIRREIDVFQPQAAPVARLSRRIKDKFDPRGILNPGLMGV